jgi:hypothetical protein
MKICPEGNLTQKLSDTKDLEKTSHFISTIGMENYKDRLNTEEEACPLHDSRRCGQKRSEEPHQPTQGHPHSSST